MNKLFLILIVLVILLYIRYNLKYEDDYQILQLNPSKLTPELLGEKRPIIVYGCEDPPQVLIQKAFRYTYLYCTKQSLFAEKIIKNTSKYAVISTDGECEIEIINPKYNKTDYKSVVIQLKNTQFLILPIFWRFKSSITVNCIYVHDIFSSMYQSLSL